jgi:hypothetical protein
MRDHHHAEPFKDSPPSLHSGRARDEWEHRRHGSLGDRDGTSEHARSGLLHDVHDLFQIDRGRNLI